MRRVHCVGELLIDFVGDPPSGDLKEAKGFIKKAGGAPANVASAVARLGGKASLHACVGNDPFGIYLKEVIAEQGVVTDGIQFSSEFTTLAFVSLSETGERDFVFSRGADAHLVFKEEVKSQMAGQILHFGSATGFLAGALRHTYERHLESALQQNCFISFDPNFRGDLWKENEKEFVARCMPFVQQAHLGKFSIEEAQMISGASLVEDAAEALHLMGVKVVLITLGGEGCYVFANGTGMTVPSLPVTAVDTTGAGDAFIGCMLWQIANEAKPLLILEDLVKLKSMVHIANAAGALTTTAKGAIDPLPSNETLKRFLSEF